jgi:hypothetical protein
VAYSGLITWGSGGGPSYREYIETPFSSTVDSSLIANKRYHFEMYINLCNASKYNSYDIGAYFSDTLISGINNWTPLPLVPQINNTISNIPDTLNWTLISGDYTAHGGERYLIIGNFKNNSLTNNSTYNASANEDRVYFYMDDVSLTQVIDNNLIIGNDTTVCVGQNLTLNASISNGTYLWQDNSTAPIYTVTQAGTYWVKVTSNFKTYTDTITVDFITIPSVNLGHDTAS